MEGSDSPVRATDPHRLAEERSIAFHAAIAADLERRPEALERASSRVAGWLEDGSVHGRYAEGWRELLRLPLEQLKARLIDPGEEMRALRQCTPFAGALGPRERWRLHKATAQRMSKR